MSIEGSKTAAQRGSGGTLLIDRSNPQILYVLTSEGLFKSPDAGNRSFGNARLARTLFEQSLATQALRLSPVTAPSREELMTISEEDVQAAIERLA